MGKSHRLEHNDTNMASLFKRNMVSLMLLQIAIPVAAQL